MGMTPNELELTEVENHYPTDRVPREMKEKAVAERLLEKLIDTKWVEKNAWNNRWLPQCVFFFFFEWLYIVCSNLSFNIDSRG